MTDFRAALVSQWTKLMHAFVTDFRAAMVSQWTKFTNPTMSCHISHNAPFRTEMFTFLFWMVHYGVWNRSIVGFRRLVYWYHCQRKHRWYIRVNINANALLKASTHSCVTAQYSIILFIFGLGISPESSLIKHHFVFNGELFFVLMKPQKLHTNIHKETVSKRHFLWILIPSTNDLWLCCTIKKLYVDYISFFEKLQS